MSEVAEVETNISTQEAAPAPAPQPELVNTEAAVVAHVGARAIVVVGPGPIPAGYALVLVAEARSYVEPVFAEQDGEQVLVSPGSSAAVTDGYPAGAALYFRTDPSVGFPEGANVKTLGVNVLQNRYDGFTPREGHVNVGPCHPAYAAANLAWQLGATAIDIQGLTDGEKERLKPWFDRLPTHAVEPAQVAVSTL